MLPSSQTRVPLALMLVCMAVCGGCSTTEKFPGEDSDLLWTALVAVAESPNYDSPDVSLRWTVKENAVYADDETRTIEIHRRLIRQVYPPRRSPRFESTNWHLRVTMLMDDEGPEVKFQSKGSAIPTNVLTESERYFADVRTMLVRGGSGSRDDAPDQTEHGGEDAMPHVEDDDDDPVAEAPVTSAPATQPDEAPPEEAPEEEPETQVDDPPLDIDDLDPGVL